MPISLSQNRHQPVQAIGNDLKIGEQRLSLADFPQDTLLQSLAEASKIFQELTNNQCHPQLASITFIATHNERALDHYFPIVNILNETEIDDFYELVKQTAEHPNFDLQLIGENKTSLTKQIPSAVRYLIAGHITEIFFYRRKILERFLHTPRHFQIYTTTESFHQDGGVSGGCYNPSRECIQLVMSRLFEGFNSTTPGVCPFLHELGHMLDFFDAGRGSIGRCEGLYPGLSPNDKYLYNPIARDLFIKGKRLELDRYLARQKGDLTQPLPIGHPYVFQNDGEFVAGYLEMFFRNPHYFAEQNLDLFNAYVELFGYDTRKAWKEDFHHYVNANQKFYTSGQIPSATKLTIPKEFSWIKMSLYSLQNWIVRILTKFFKT